MHVGKQFLLSYQSFGTCNSNQLIIPRFGIRIQILFHPLELIFHTVQRSSFLKLEFVSHLAHLVRQIWHQRGELVRSELQNSFGLVFRLVIHCHPNQLDRKLFYQSFFDNEQLNLCECRKKRVPREVSR